MVAYTTYAKALFPKGHGHPLWEPDPGEYAPVEIADVGWSNRLGFPDGHTPLLVGDIRRRTPLPKKPEYISSESVRKKGIDLSVSTSGSVPVGGGISFECVKNQGAVLVMGDIAYRQDAVDLARFSDYIIANHRTWLAFANDHLGRGLSVTDLILVTGCDKTSDWACAAWADISHSASASFMVDAPGLVQGNASIWGRWESSSSVDRNAGPQRLDPTIPTSPVVQSPSSDAMSIDEPSSLQEPLRIAPLVPPTCSDQCVFVRGFHIGDRSTWFRRKTIIDVGDGFMTIRKPLDLKNKENKDLEIRQTQQQYPSPTSGGSFDNSASRRSAESFEIGTQDDEEAELVIVDIDKRDTPVEAMIGFIFENSTAELALIHDDDLVSLIRHSSVRGVHDYKSWIWRLSPAVYLDVENVGMFESTYMLRSSANDLGKSITLPTLPLLAGDKGDTSSTSPLTLATKDTPDSSTSRPAPYGAYGMQPSAGPWPAENWSHYNQSFGPPPIPDASFTSGPGRPEPVTGAPHDPRPYSPSQPSPDPRRNEERYAPPPDAASQKPRRREKDVPNSKSLVLVSAQNSMPRPREERAQRKSNGPGNTPMPRPKQLASRYRPQLKSAMKRPAQSVFDPSDQPRRTQLGANSDPRRTLNPMTRTRASSNAAIDIPDHLFVSLHGGSYLQIQNVNSLLVNELRQSLLMMWPHGVEYESTEDNTWRVNFAKNPWSSTGQDAIMVLRMIIQLFERITLGYDFINTINIQQTHPRLVFAETNNPGVYINHFVAYFSRSGRKLTLVDPPQMLGEVIGSRLRVAWPHKISADKTPEDGIYTVGLRATTFGSYTPDKHLFMSYTLQEIRSVGYQFVASVPLGRRGPLGLGSRREVLVFKDMMSKSTQH